MSQRAASICVVVTTYQHARYLGEALDSVMGQTHAADEIIVVDDGSTDNPGAVTGRYPAVRLITQKNQGPSAARNAGLKAATSEAIVFLDADDRLLPHALELGLHSLARKPKAAFAFGGHRRMDAQGDPLGADRPAPASLTYADLLKGNRVAMLATVTFQRETLLGVGGFDADLRGCEDYDVYLRLAQDHGVATFPNAVAEYRQHDSNTSRNAAGMLAWALNVMDRQQGYISADETLSAAWADGRARWIEFYRELMPKTFSERLRRKAKSLLPRRQPRHRAPWGDVQFGDLDRVQPISDELGYDRGLPVDRGYVEAFFQSHAADIHGRVLEAGDEAAYSRRIGGGRVTTQDVLAQSPDAALATIIGELSTPGLLPTATFDCIVLPQTLQHVFDLAAAVREIHHALKPGGIALVTVPGFASNDPNSHWSLTLNSATRLFAEVFGAENVTAASYGNVFAATALLQGLAVEELDPEKLGVTDPAFPVVITVRASKAGG